MSCIIVSSILLMTNQCFVGAVCWPGTVFHDQVGCVPCQPGTYSRGGAAPGLPLNCTLCDESTIAPTPGRSHCTPCNNGEQPSWDRTRCGGGYNMTVDWCPGDSAITVVAHFPVRGCVPVLRSGISHPHRCVMHATSHLLLIRECSTIKL